MKARTATLHSKKQGARGYPEILFRYFENDPESASVKRVERMLSLLSAAEKYAIEHESISDLDTMKHASAGVGLVEWGRRYHASRNAYVRTLEEIDKALRHYQWRATVSEKSNDGHFQYTLYCVADPKSGPLGDWEGSVVSHLLELSRKRGELSRFRLCPQCGGWFYAITGHQRFCGDSCRRQNAAQNPEFKEKRRTYMRERYRPLQKELQDRSLKGAKGSRQPKGRK